MKTSCKVRAASRREPHTVLFHLYKMYRIQANAGRSMIAVDCGSWQGRRVTAHGDGVSFGMNENILK